MSFRSLFGFLNKKSSSKSSSTKKSSQKTKQRKTKKRQPKPFNTPDITSINIDNHEIVNDGELVFSDINENPNIVEQASQELAARYSQHSKDVRNQYLQSVINDEMGYDSNVQAGLDESSSSSKSE